MASDDPVLPPVYSITRMPGFNAPRRSAPSIIASAMRSLYDPVGLKYSSLTTTSADPGRTSRCNRTTGVEPMVLSTELTGAGKVICFGTLELWNRGTLELWNRGTASIWYATDDPRLGHRHHLARPVVRPRNLFDAPRGLEYH